jgi:hypothetical protein
MRSGKGLFARLALALVLLAPGLLAAEVVPDSQPFEIAKPEPPPTQGSRYDYVDTTTITLGSYGFAVGWTADFQPGDPHDFERASGFAAIRRVLPDGQPAERSYAGFAGFDGDLIGPVMVRIGERRFVTAWWEGSDAGPLVWFRRFRAGDRTLDAEAIGLRGESPYQGYDCCPSIASDGKGRFVIAWWRSGYGLLENRPELEKNIAQVFGPDGLPVTPEITVTAPPLKVSVGRPLAGMDAAGNVTVLWTEGGETWGRRFDRDGRPFGERFRMPGRDLLAMAVRPSGEMIVAWTAPLHANVVLLSRFTADGRRVGPLVRVARSSYSLDPVMAVDRKGRVALFWRDDPGPALAVFDSSLARLGQVALDVPVADFWTGGGVAFGEDGRILTTWVGPWKNQGRDSILGQFWKVR